MKKVLLATALSLCVTSAFAANPTAVLKVRGTLTNAACTPALSNGGTVDYGTINLGSLNPTNVNQLGQKNIDLTINCAAATRVSWNMVDDRADTNANLEVANARFDGDSLTSTDQTFGVGKTAGNVNIGSYSLFVKTDSVKADNVTVDPIIRSGTSGAWTKSVNGSAQGQSLRDFTVATTGSVDPMAFQTATFPLVTSLAIDKTSTLAITDDTNLDGQITISLRYL